MENINRSYFSTTIDVLEYMDDWTRWGKSFNYFVKHQQLCKEWLHCALCNAVSEVRTALEFTLLQFIDINEMCSGP